jgi:hypothetical protein
MTFASSVVDVKPSGAKYMRGLNIPSPWIEHILEGRKTWEIRGKSTSVRERIALIKDGSKRVFGTAALVDCLGPFTLKELAEHQDKHQLPPEILAETVKKLDGTAFVWVLSDVRVLVQPQPYKKIAPSNPDQSNEAI